MLVAALRSTNLGDDLFGDIGNAALIGVENQPRSLSDVIVQDKRVAVFCSDTLNNGINFLGCRLRGGVNVLCVTLACLLIGPLGELELILLL